MSAKTRPGLTGARMRLDGWADGQAGPVLERTSLTLSGGGALPLVVLQLTLDPASAAMRAAVAGGSRHYFRLAGATLRPLAAEAVLTFARGDAYIAVSPGARLLAESPAIARFLHLRDGFNAERLVEGVLNFLAEESGQSDFSEDVTVFVVEAR